MNFNFTQSPEYDLNTSLAEEMINLYGVPTKFLITDKINKDNTVFGDYSHMKSDSNKIFTIYMLPENSEDWDNGDYSLTSFGMINSANVSLFVPKSAFDGIADIAGGSPITGNLVIFPNNKIMEITDTDFIVPGVNNLFTYNDDKSIYKLTCKPYDFKLINEVDSVDISVDSAVPYDTLDVYFNELIDSATAQDNEAEILASVQTVEPTDTLDSKVNKPIVDRSEDDVWGQFK